MYGAIHDVVVHRDHQRFGVGEGIMRWLLDKGAGLSWITLFAVPGKEGFYRKIGFKSMKSAMMLPKSGMQERVYCTVKVPSGG